MRRSLAVLLILYSSAFASGPCLSSHDLHYQPKPEEAPSPWFTGPLLTPAGHVVPIGYINVEPYFFCTVTNGLYDNDWNSSSLEDDIVSTLFQVPIYIGITEWANILVVGQASWHTTQDISTLDFGDIILEFDAQVLEDTRHNSLPGLKLYVQETFPTGRFDTLDDGKFSTDIGGAGSFRTQFGFVLTRLFNVWRNNFLSLRLNGFYTAPSPFKVDGINLLGGTPNTKGTVNPGTSFGALFGLEYNFTRHWAFACDLQTSYANKTTFTGFPGRDADGNLIDLNQPVSFSFSMAPALEYNFNQSFGIIAGAWFTLAGKNSRRFTSAVLAINYFGPTPIERKHKYRTKGGGSGGS